MGTLTVGTPNKQALEEVGKTVPTMEELRNQYVSLGERFDSAPLVTEIDEIDSSMILCFDYEYPSSNARVEISTEEFTAVCPWTDLPDYGTLKVTYVPDLSVIELKSLKYYLMQYRNVRVVQEHAANRILSDLVEASNPLSMEILMDYKIRGGLHTTVVVTYGQS